MARIRYIHTARTVATLLREHCTARDGTVSTFYKFVFCLCLPFMSLKWYDEIAKAYVLASCTQSREQIFRVIELFTGATLSYSRSVETHMVSMDGSAQGLRVTMDGTADANFNVGAIPYFGVPNQEVMEIQLNGADTKEVERLLALLIPFYVNIKIVYA